MVVFRRRGTTSEPTRTSCCPTPAILSTPTGRATAATSPPRPTTLKPPRPHLGRTHSKRWRTKTEGPVICERSSCLQPTRYLNPTFDPSCLFQFYLSMSGNSRFCCRGFYHSEKKTGETKVFAPSRCYRCNT